MKGQRKKPDGTELEWLQIGINNSLKDAQFPYFIEWLSKNHPSSELKSPIKITQIEMMGNQKEIETWMDCATKEVLGEVKIEWINQDEPSNSESGIIAVHLETRNGKVRID